MLYLLRADGSMHWTELPAQLAFDAAREYGADLSMLDWAPSEWRAGDLEIAIALRHGVACRTGVVVAGALIASLERPRVLREAREAAKGSAQALSVKNMAMDRLVPGWLASGRRVETVIDRAADEAIEREIEQIEALMATPVDQRLASHWRVLGGLVPELT
jgi:hypothetical protein